MKGAGCFYHCLNLVIFCCGTGEAQIFLLGMRAHLREARAQIFLVGMRAYLREARAQIVFVGMRAHLKEARAQIFL